jgi:hypothetical protein
MLMVWLSGEGGRNWAAEGKPFGRIFGKKSFFLSTVGGVGSLYLWKGSYVSQEIGGFGLERLKNEY